MSSSLSEWLRWMEQQHPAQIELGLDRVKQAYSMLNIQFSYPVITVAGTNGKGSFIRAIELLCQQRKINVGSFTSPHIFKYNERIKYNLQPLTDAVIVESIQHIAKLCETLPLTYFEISTLSALYALSQLPLDVLVLEVGLGGRLDAVNVVDADIAVITSIALDHQDYLGDTLDKIAYEKAGILRNGQDVFLGAGLPAVINKQAQKMKCKLHQSGDDFDIAATATESDAEGTLSQSTQAESYLYQEQQQLAIKESSLHPNSLALALAVFNHLYKLDASDVSSLHHSALEGRWQRVSQKPCIVADVAHNPAAMNNLAHKLASTQRPWVTIIGMLSDKDAHHCTQLLAPHIEHWLICDLNNPRAYPAEHLQSIICDEAKVSLEQTQCFSHCNLALDYYLKNYTDDYDLLICGSFFTVAETLQYYESLP